jgi:hypothetical protein
MTEPARRRSLDPQGKRALFEAPVSAAPDAIRPRAAAKGRTALYSSQPRQAGAALIECASCATRTRVSPTALVAGVALSLPTWRSLSTRLMRCPACHRWTRCRISLRD